MFSAIFIERRFNAKIKITFFFDVVAVVVLFKSQKTKLNCELMLF